jgi:F0F1-type ATP synthase assembly protein I
MGWLIFKYLVTAAVVVAVSEAARRSDRLGALIAALPLVTFLVLVWLYVEKQPQAKIANHAWYTFWYVVPTLPMFLAFPLLLERLGFWPALLASAGITVACFVLFALAVRPFGIDLLP